jgi:hypothetical protein
MSDGVCMWNLEGMTVTGNYYDNPVSGKVEMSRIAWWDGGVKHTVVLDKPIQMRWRTEPTSRVILKHSEILTVRD